MEFEYFEVDGAVLRAGLEEALKHQLNLVLEAVEYGFSNQFGGRCKDFETLRRKAQAADINTKLYSEKYTSLQTKYEKKFEKNTR